MTKPHPFAASFNQHVTDERSLKPRPPLFEEALRLAGEPEPMTLRSIIQADEIADLLRSGPGAHLWVTDIFDAILLQIAPADSFRFWKEELQQRVMRDGVMAQGLYPDDWAYLVSQWRSPYAEPLLQVKKCIY